MRYKVKKLLKAFDLRLLLLKITAVNNRFLLRYYCLVLMKHLLSNQKHQMQD